MSARKTLYTLASCLIPLTLVSAAAATNRTWQGDDENWDNTASKWSPSGVPDANDVAIFNTSNSVDLGFFASTEIAGLTLSNNINLHTNSHSLLVDGLVQLSDTGTDLFVEGSGATLSVSSATVNSGAGINIINSHFNIYGFSGTGLLNINSGGSVIGNGTILLNDSVSPGVEVLELDGSLTAASTTANDFTSNSAATLTVTVGDADGVLDLDGNSGNGTININRNDTLNLNGGVLNGPFSGTMNLGYGGTFSRDVDWEFDGTLNVVPGGGSAAGGPSMLAGAGLTMKSGAHVNIDAGENLRLFSQSFTTTGGTINNSGLITFSNTQPTNITGITFNMIGNSASLTVSPGANVSITSNDLELDGAGTATNVVTIGSGGKLDLSLSGAADTNFTGTINLNNGILEVTDSANAWTLGGTVNVGANTGVSVIQGEQVTFLPSQVNIPTGGVLDVKAPAVLQVAYFSGSGTLKQSSPLNVSGGGEVVVRTYVGDLNTTSINPGAGLSISVTNLGDATDQFNNTVTINSGTLNVQVADFEWQLGTSGGAPGNIVLKKTSNTPYLGGGSTLRVTNGLIDVDGGAIIDLPLIVEQTYAALRFIDHGGTIEFFAPLELHGGNIIDVTEDPNVDTRVYLWDTDTATALKVSGTGGAIFGDALLWERGKTVIDSGATLSVFVDRIQRTGLQAPNDIIENHGHLHVDLDLYGNTASWAMDGSLHLYNGTIDNGDRMLVGDDGGLDAHLDVESTGLSYINSPVQFNSDAVVNIHDNASLVLTNTVYFSPQKDARDATFEGDGTLYITSSASYYEPTTIYMGFVNWGSSAEYVYAPTTLHVGTMSPFTGSLNIYSPLTVYRPHLYDPWLIQSNAIVDATGDDPADVFLAGSDIGFYGVLNAHGEGQISARLDIGGTINIKDVTGSLTINGGTIANPNTLLSGSHINGPGQLIVPVNRALVGAGTVSAPVYIDQQAELRARNGTLRITGSLELEQRATIGTADETGTLQVDNPWTLEGILDLRGNSTTGVTGATITNDRYFGGYGRVYVSQLVNNGTIVGKGGTLILDRFNSLAGYDWDGTTNLGALYAFEGNTTLEATESVTFGGVIGVGHGAPLSDVMLFQGTNFQVYQTDPNESYMYLAGGIYRSTVQHTFATNLLILDALSELDVPDAIFFNGTNAQLFADLQLRKNTTIDTDAHFESDGGRLINLNGATLTIKNGADVANLQIDNRGRLVMGASAGQISLASLSQSDTGTLEIELGGTDVSAFDRLLVSGPALIDGTIEFSLINGFVPSVGQTFQFLTAAGGITGAFDTVTLPSLPNGLAWGVDINSGFGQLFVVVNPPGDYNHNGFVDAADYVGWRKNDNTPAGYNTWRSHFGQPFGSGGEVMNTAAPEPTTIMLLMFPAAGWCLQRRRAA